MGGDSAGVGSYNIRTHKDPKVFMRPPFIIGFTTSFRMGQLLMSDERFSIREQKKLESEYDYIVSAFIPAIQKLFEEGGFLKRSNEVKSGGTFILGYKDHLFTIDNDFQVAEFEEDYTACGCGEDYALGSLFSSSNDKIVDKIEQALKTAEYFSSGVRRPFKIIEMKY